MSKKVSIILICIIILISLIISIYIPNREKIAEELEDTSINYSVIEENGKVGIAQNGQNIIEPQYDKIIIPNLHRAVFLCQKGEDKKFVNSKNEEIFTEYNNVELIKYDENQYQKNILKYEKDGKFGLINFSGKTVTGAKYEEISGIGHKEGEVLIKKDGKYGVIDENGNVKIKNKYDSIEIDEYYTEKDGYKKSGYIVCITTDEGYRYGYYDNECVQVLNEDYNQISRLAQIENEDIYLLVAENGQFGVFVNNTKIIDTKYQSIDYNVDLEMFIVERTGKFGAINLNGLEILKTEFSNLQINGIYIYGTKDEENKVYDSSGKEVDIPFDTIIQKTDSEYFIKNAAGSFSILNSDFEQISTQSYMGLDFAFDKYFIATNAENKVGIIDSQENTKLEFKYDVIQLIKDTSLIQAIDFATQTTYIYDYNFELIVQVNNANIEYLDDGIKIYNNETEYLLDDKGKLK